MSFQIPTPGKSPWSEQAPRPQAEQQQSWRPPVAPSPYEKQQTPLQPPDSYFPPQQTIAEQQQWQPQQAMNGLTQQMGAVGLESSAKSRRKKDRHAYHQLEQEQPPTPGFASTPGAGLVQPTQPWLQNQPIEQPSPYAGTPISMDGQKAGPQGISGAASRVNPDQIPSVPLSRDLPTEHYQKHVYPTMEQRLPPPATTPFVAFDQGNASPKFARLTMNAIPMSNDQLQHTGLPIGLYLQPLARQTDGEQAIPVLDFGDIGPPRCRRCRAYINPFMVFSNGGNRMTCNLCGHPNEVAPEYFAPTDPSGLRVDRQQRPELMLGTCEFLVPKEYWVKEPLPLRQLFLIDVSLEACTRGFLEGTCQSILEALYGDDLAVDEQDDAEPQAPRLPPGSRIGIMAFDREIHFFNVAAALPSAQELVVADLEDPFAAISPEHLFVDPQECKKNLVALLQKMPQMFATTRHPEPAFLPPLNAALAALAESGGKIICSLANLPTYGPGKLFLRDKGHPPAEDSEAAKNLLKTEYVGYKKLQADMVKAGVGIDFFLAAPAGGYLDLATIGLVAEKTGGEVFYYPNWAWPRDSLRLRKEITHSVQREQGYAALMKVRCSNGLQVGHYSGNFTQHTFGADLEMASLSEDSGMCVTFTYDGKVSFRLNPIATMEERRRATSVQLDAKLDAHFQSALLYTTASGQRRVRCSNVVATISETAKDAMKLVDQDAVLAVLAKQAASQIPEKFSKDVRTSVQDKLIEVLSGYRKHLAGQHPGGQLVLPENLKEFAMYMLGLMKSRALKGGREPSDRRIYDTRLIKGIDLRGLSLYLYPRIIAVHSLEPEEGFADENGHLKMPRGIRATFGAIQEGGAYIVDNGQILLLWLHAQVSPNLLEDLFGEGFNDLQGLDPNLSALPVLETHLNAQVRNILTHLEENRSSKGMAIQLARQGLDGAEFEFARLLYEDRNGEASSYVDWLVMLHRGVGMELSGKKQAKTEETIQNTITSITGSVPWG